MANTTEINGEVVYVVEQVGSNVHYIRQESLSDREDAFFGRLDVGSGSLRQALEAVKWVKTGKNAWEQFSSLVKVYDQAGPEVVLQELLDAPGEEYAQEKMAKVVNHVNALNSIRK